jgi:hypothetical protein
MPICNQCGNDYADVLRINKNGRELDIRQL